MQTEIRRVEPGDITPQVMQDLEALFNDGFAKETVSRKFNWQSFSKFWEAGLHIPMMALWFLYEEDLEKGEEHVVGLIGGSVFDNMLTDHKIGVELCWRTAAKVKGNGLGWDLLATFMEWAIANGASRIITHRFLSNPEADERFDKRIAQMGFKPSGCEYYFDI